MLAGKQGFASAGTPRAPTKPSPNRTGSQELRTFTQRPSGRLSFAGQRKTLLSPLANATVHGGDIRISHSLQGIGSQRGAESSTAVQNKGGARVRYALLNVAFNYSLAQMYGRRQVVFRPFVVLADIDEKKICFAVEHLLHIVHGYFADPLLGVVNDVEKSRRVMGCHAQHDNAKNSGSSPEFSVRREERRFSPPPFRKGGQRMGHPFPRGEK